MTQKRKPKTLKEKRFANEYARTGNATEAAARAYDVKNRLVAKSIGSQNLSKLDFSDLFEEFGFTDQVLVKNLVSATQAKRLFNKKSIPDWNVRLKAIELCMKLKGSLALAERQVRQRDAVKDEYENHTPEQKKLLRSIFKSLSHTEISEYIKEIMELDDQTELTPMQMIKVRSIELYQEIEEIEQMVVPGDDNAK